MDNFFNAPNNQVRNCRTVIVLIAVNIFVFILGLLPRFSYYYVLMPLAIGHVYFYDTYWVFFTYFFIHGNNLHVLLNMLGLFFFGSAVEKKIGSLNFLFMYFFSGLLTGLASYCVYVSCGAYDIKIFGAEGAVYGIIASYLVFFKAKKFLFLYIIPLNSWLAAVFFTVIALYHEVASFNQGYTHFTLLFGFIFGLLYLFIRFRVNPFQKSVDY